MKFKDFWKPAGEKVIETDNLFDSVLNAIDPESKITLVAENVILAKPNPPFLKEYFDLIKIKTQLSSYSVTLTDEIAILHLRIKLLFTNVSLSDASSSIPVDGINGFCIKFIDNIYNTYHGKEFELNGGETVSNVDLNLDVVIEDRSSGLSLPEAPDVELTHGVKIVYRFLQDEEKIDILTGQIIFIVHNRMGLRSFVRKDAKTGVLHFKAVDTAYTIAHEMGHVFGLADRYHIYQYTIHNQSATGNNGKNVVADFNAFTPMVEPYFEFNDLEYGQTKTNWQNNLMTLATGNLITSKQWNIICSKMKEHVYEQYTFFDHTSASRKDENGDALHNTQSFIGLNNDGKVITDAIAYINSFGDISHKNESDHYSYFNPTFGQNPINIENFVNSDGIIDSNETETLICGGSSITEIVSGGHKNDKAYLDKIDKFKFYGGGSNKGRTQCWNATIFVANVLLFGNREVILKPYSISQ